jgi:uncharacterized protein YceK
MKITKIVASVAAGIVAVALSGCGTLVTHAFSQNPGPYEGVKTDVQAGTEAFSKFQPVKGSLWLLDTPLSAVGDTVTLPQALHNRPARSSGTGSE